LTTSCFTKSSGERDTAHHITWTPIDAYYYYWNRGFTTRFWR